MTELISRPTCEVCGETGVRLYQDLRDDLFAADGTWALDRCSNAACSLIWLNPSPRPDNLEPLYQHYYTHEGAGPTGFLRLARALYRFTADVLLAPFGLPFERHRARLNYLGGETPARLADIGCGDGAFLAAMAARGWTVAGVDFDADAVAVARKRGNLDIRVGTVQSLIAAGQTYQVVTASHVIEHVPNPVEFLHQCGELLAPGGRIFLRTPNGDSFGHWLYGRAWRGLEPPRHLQIFTLSSLTACAQKADLRTLSCVTTAVEAEWFLIASRFLKRKGAFRLRELSKRDLLEWMVLAPVFAIIAKLAWLRDRRCGEEIIAVLSRPTT